MSSFTTPTGPPSKRARNEQSNNGTQTPPSQSRTRLPLQGFVICLPPTTPIRHLKLRLQAWEPGVKALGGTFTRNIDDPAITHVLVGHAGIASIPKALVQRCIGATSDSDEDHAARDHNPVMVDQSWLEQTLLKRQPQVEAQHRPVVPPTAVHTPQQPFYGGQSSDKDVSEASKRVLPPFELQNRQRWLGEAWHEGCASMTLNELVLQQIYNEERSKKIGNEPVALALAELASYERALHEDYWDHPEKGEVVNHRALRYGRAAAVVRGCAYKISGNLEGGELPFVGPATSKQINSIVRTGTCETLEGFRNDQRVADSKGAVRRDTFGGRTRLLFHKLPGVGQRTALLWYNLGLKSYEDAEAAAVEGGVLDPNGPNKMSIEQKFSLEHRDDLLEGTTKEEVEEMMGVLRSALLEVSYPGWTIELVGGGRRSNAFHDADFLITHPTQSVEGVIGPLKDHLIAAGYLFPPSQAMCRVQSGLLPDHIQKIKDEHKKDPSAAPGYQTLDRFDHIYGNVRTKGGKVRRMDVIICPCEEWGFGFLGWVGSRTFLRMQRNYAKDLGMYLNSHGLLLKESGESYLVPQERPPRLKGGKVEYPKGWSAERKVEKEEDVFELLGTPYRPPGDRNCF